MPLQCLQCGAHNADGRQSCVVCGSSLASATVLTSQPQAGVRPPSADPTQAPRSGPPLAAQQPPEGQTAAMNVGPEGTPRPPQGQPGPTNAPASVGEEQLTGGNAAQQQAVAVSPASPFADLEEPQATLVPPLQQGGVAPQAEAQEAATQAVGAGGTGLEQEVQGAVQEGAFPQPQYFPPRQEMPQPGGYPGWGYQVQMPYGYPSWQEGVGYMPQFGYGFPPMNPYGMFAGFPSYGFVPPMPWPGYPPYGMPFYPPMQPPPVYPGGYGAAGYGAGAYAAQASYPSSPYSQPYPTQKRRMKTVYIVLIIVGVLLLIGGAVTAAILLTGNSNATFKLGDGSVTGADIEFTDLVLKQQGSSVTLTGKYDNNTKREGKVYLTVQAVSSGAEQLMSFTVPVTPGKGHSVSQKKTETAKLSQATLGALIYQGTSSTDSDDSDSDAYPWETTPDGNSTSPGNENKTTPFSTVPFSSPSSRTVPSIQ